MVTIDKTRNRGKAHLVLLVSMNLDRLGWSQEIRKGLNTKNTTHASNTTNHWVYPNFSDPTYYACFLFLDQEVHI
jgi:hypothetical protein